MDDFNGTDFQEGHMNVVSSTCRKFSRRHDFDMFSMSDYRSCENCRRLNGKISVKRTWKKDEETYEKWENSNTCNRIEL